MLLLQMKRSLMLKNSGDKDSFISLGEGQIKSAGSLYLALFQLRAFCLESARQPVAGCCPCRSLHSGSMQPSRQRAAAGSDSAFFSEMQVFQTALHFAALSESLVFNSQSV